ncbi:hypothetical protein QYE76_013138 [Lolium multiflorum]|uniref:Reverse transcriptase Ty1/copia-type domain-containing protein n=1 Tax=Lolium multiflorum TaxID=4521 RepID=A0AAD8TYC5_LOLMU|nr:hypothetical protein QYE76_013138 [Lolium multiflorum]
MGQPAGPAQPPAHPVGDRTWHRCHPAVSRGLWLLTGCSPVRDPGAAPGPAGSLAGPPHSAHTASSAPRPRRRAARAPRSAALQLAPLAALLARPVVPPVLGGRPATTGLLANTTTLLRTIITSLQHEFSMSDLGELHHFLGINVHRNASGLFLSQQQYALEILDRANMLHCNPISTPVDTRSKLSATDGAPFHDASLYRSLAGALQYLTLSRPDLAYAVQQICLFMHAPTTSHFQLIKRVLRYLRGTTHYGLQFYRSTAHDLVAYSDADWAGCPDTRKSTSGFCVFLGQNLVSWSSKRQPTVSRSSAEAEYRAVANCIAESYWLRQLLLELHQPPARATIVYCDNVSAMYLSSNPVQHQRTKHVEIDLHFVRDRVALGEAKVLHVPSSSQFADIFTKGLPSPVFSEFRSSLNIVSTDVQSAGGC